MDFNMRADYSEVAIGHLALPGLMAEDGQFGLAVPQLADQLQLAKDHASRDFKAMLGTDSQLAKWISPLNPKAVNVLTLDQFKQITLSLALSGNVKAIEFVRVLLGLSLYQIFCDAFHVRMDAIDRQQWLEESQDRAFSEPALMPEPTTTDQLNTIIAQQQQVIEILSGQNRNQPRRLTLPPWNGDRDFLHDPSSPNSWVLTPELIAFVGGKVVVKRSGQTIDWKSIRTLYRPSFSTRCLKKLECFAILDHVADADRGAWCGDPYYSKFKVFRAK